MQVKPENILITNDGILEHSNFDIVHDLRSINILFNKKQFLNKVLFSQQTSTSAQASDACYLAFEVLSGRILITADAFHLGSTALALVSDYDMPVNADSWTVIRQLELSIKIISVLADNQLKELLI